MTVNSNNALVALVASGNNINGTNNMYPASAEILLMWYTSLRKCDEVCKINNYILLDISSSKMIFSSTYCIMGIFRIALFTMVKNFQKLFLKNISDKIDFQK